MAAAGVTRLFLRQHSQFDIQFLHILIPPFRLNSLRYLGLDVRQLTGTQKIMDPTNHPPPQMST